MKSILIASVLCLVTTFVFGQKAKPPKMEYGAITMTEMEMERYEKDTAATAVVLFHTGDCMIKNDFHFTFKRHIRIKFLNTKNISQYSSAKFFHPTDGFSVSKLKGTTYNLENGKIVKTELNSKNVFKRKLNDDYSEYTFTMPNVKPGSVIEYAYVVDANYGDLFPWDFQMDVPVVYTQYETSIPNALSYKKDFKGTLPPPVITSDYEGHERMVMTDVPAFKREPFLTHESDYRSSMDYFLSEFFRPTTMSYSTAYYAVIDKSWSAIAKDLYNNSIFVGVFKMNPWLDPIVENVIGGASTEEEKAKRIHSYVKNSIQWDSTTSSFQGME